MGDGRGEARRPSLLLLRRNRRGQASVEFAVFTVLLILAMFLIVQLMWIAVQKWQFNHFAAYSARVWSVQKDQSPGDSLERILLAGILRWDLLKRDYVKFMWVSDETTKTIDDVDYTGIEYTGFTQLLSIYRNQFGETFFDYPPSLGFVFSLIEVPTTGLVGYKTFIPIQKEPEEQPGSDRDNDCNETPCETGNKR